MSKINFGTKVSLSEAASLIAACGSTNRLFLQGEPGIGKSSIMKALREKLGDGYVYAYFDCAQKDLGDIAMPSVNRERRVTEYFPNAALGIEQGKPCVIMLDEFTKAFQSVQNMLHPLLEVHNPRLGDIPLPEGSIVFLTGNLSSDGVGDSIKGHSLNRITRIEIAKPSVDEWLKWAIGAEIDPVVMAWVRQFPQCLDSYTDSENTDNPYIYNPRRSSMLPFVSPRSLELASGLVSQRSKFADSTLIAALAGTVGEAAARDMQAFIAYQDELPTREEIINSPLTARIPESAGACSVMTFKLIALADKDNFAKIMQYVERMEAEWQAVFCINIAESNKHAIAFGSRSFTSWVSSNSDLL